MARDEGGSGIWIHSDSSSMNILVDFPFLLYIFQNYSDTKAFWLVSRYGVDVLIQQLIQLPINQIVHTLSHCETRNESDIENKVLHKSNPL